jgi:IPT/TIG domain
VAARLAVRLQCLVGWVALSACSANDDIPAPALSAVVPDAATAGTTVMVSGSALCQEPRTSDGDGDPLECQHLGTMMFNTAPGVVVSYTDTMVLVEVPALPPGGVSVRVSVAGRSSNSLGFIIE